MWKDFGDRIAVVTLTNLGVMIKSRKDKNRVQMLWKMDKKNWMDRVWLKKISFMISNSYCFPSLLYSLSPKTECKHKVKSIYFYNLETPLTRSVWKVVKNAVIRKTELWGRSRLWKMEWFLYAFHRWIKTSILPWLAAALQFSSSVLTPHDGTRPEHPFAFGRSHPTYWKHPQPPLLTPHPLGLAVKCAIIINPDGLRSVNRYFEECAFKKKHDLVVNKRTSMFNRLLYLLLKFEHKTFSSQKITHLI